jgi:hypothetical protein
MTTYVLVHGGHHGGWCYQKVARLLRKAGHEVYSPTLTGLGERRQLLSPAVDLEMHIAERRLAYGHSARGPLTDGTVFSSMPLYTF